MKLGFDVKTNDMIVFNGHVIMSRSEEPYLRRLIEQLAGLPIEAVLEVGYGLGITARIIQNVLHPVCHHIVEVEDQLYSDCLEFCSGIAGAAAFAGDCYEYIYPRTYDLLFFDPCDYDFALGRVTRCESFTEEFNREVVLAHRVLRPGGFLCHAFFGDVPLPELDGFTLHEKMPFQDAPFLLHTGAQCVSARLGYYRKA